MRKYIKLIVLLLTCHPCITNAMNSIPEDKIRTLFTYCPYIVDAIRSLPKNDANILVEYCYHISDANSLMSENAVREIETQDNEICLSRGTNTKNNFSTKYYWNCRKNLINQRIRQSRDLKGKNKFYTTELKRMRKVINNIIERIDRNLEKEYSDDFDQKEDFRIVLAGDDQYYYNLLKFLHYNYPKIDINSKKEINEIIKLRKKDEELKKENNLKRDLTKFPECIKYEINTKEFDDCISFKYQIEECKETVAKKIKEKDINNKFLCKQNSIEKYPDYMALYNSEYEDLKNKKTDPYNINREKDVIKQKRIAELNKLMSGPRLSKNQLIELRKLEEKKCLMDKELENNLFNIMISGECEKLIKNKFKNIDVPSKQIQEI